MPRVPDFKDRLSALPEDVTTAELEPLARELADRCSAESYPKKSIAAVLRHARKVAPDTTVEAIRELAETALAEREGEEETNSPPLAETFVGIGEAARRLQISVKTLADRLREVRYRRLYGWPWWDGHQWNFSPVALDTARRAAHAATLPWDEPAAHVALLPSWCQKTDPGAAGP